MKDPEIIPPTNATLEVPRRGPARTWVDVRYNLAVVIGRGQSTAIGTGGIGLAPDMSAQRVFGRALGERSDGPCFYSSVDLPWIWEDDGYDWRKTALKRLNTFLSPDCCCESREAEIVYCDLHKAHIASWSEMDEQTLRSTRAIMLREPYAGYGNGPLPTTTVMHRDYPWIRHDHRRTVWMCMMCRGEMGEFANPSYRNVFINRHSHCGFHNPPQPKVVNRKELMVQLGVAVCRHCEAPVYDRAGTLFHQDGYRPCHWSSVTYAEAA